MKANIFLSLTFVSLIVSGSYCQIDCSTGRFLNEVFTTLNTTSNIQYGQNINLTGGNEILLLDVYEPAGDSMTERPLIIWAHGGGFLFGDKTSTDVVPLSQDFAKRGYVTASIDYRLGMNGLPVPGPDSADATESVIRAVHDARAAIRFFKKDYAENGNTYGIDTSNIFLGGVSAGAITAVHLAYLNKENELPSYIDTSQAGLGGGIEGNSGNAGYKSNVRAIISSAGALKDTAWMETDDTPIISFHGDMDATVPYGTDIIYVQGFYAIMMIDGSSSIHEQAENLGMNHCFEPWPGQDHVPHVGNAAYYDTLVTMTSNFLMQFVCGGPAVCNYNYDTSGVIGISDQYVKNELTLNVFPNPAGTYTTVSLGNHVPLNATVHLYDALGRKIRMDVKVQGTELIIEREDLPRGIYYIRLVGHEELYTAKLIFE